MNSDPNPARPEFSVAVGVRESPARVARYERLYYGRWVHAAAGPWSP